MSEALPLSRFWDYPNFPGSRRGGPSREAAESISAYAPTLREEVLSLIRGEPMSAHECAAVLNQTVPAVQPRLSELVRMKLIEDSGIRRINASGRMATVWCAVTATITKAA